MKRTLDITNSDSINEWVFRSIENFNTPGYLDRLLDIYPFQEFTRQPLDAPIRRQIRMAHQAHNDDELLELLSNQERFSYNEPVWHLITEQENFLNDNPIQRDRILQNLYDFTADELVKRLESAPDLNRTIGPMFRNWSLNNFASLSLDKFQNSTTGIFILNATEQESTDYLQNVYNLALSKRPDLVAKVNHRIIIGEAKWVGQSGGNQGNHIDEVLNFCADQRGDIFRVGIVDGFPWTTHLRSGHLCNKKETVKIQESEFDVLSALLVSEYLNHLLCQR